MQYILEKQWSFKSQGGSKYPVLSITGLSQRMMQ